MMLSTILCPERRLFRASRLVPDLRAVALRRPVIVVDFVDFFFILRYHTLLSL